MLLEVSGTLVIGNKSSLQGSMLASAGQGQHVRGTRKLGHWWFQILILPTLGLQLASGEVRSPLVREAGPLAFPCGNNFSLPSVPSVWAQEGHLVPHGMACPLGTAHAPTQCLAL